MISASSHITRRGHLAISERRAETGEHGLVGDALLLVSSWERRCTEICATQLGQFHSAAVVRFAETGDSGRRADHDDRLVREAIDRAEHYVELEVRPVCDFFRWRDALANFIITTRATLGRPIDLVVDMTCLPKYYLLLVLGFSVKIGAVRSISFFYAEGRYAPADSNTVLAADHAFTHGEWESFPVPYLEGKLNPERKIRIIASIGFETFQARKFIRSYEAEQHVLLRPFPGFCEEYEDRSEGEALALANNLDVEPGDMIKAPAGGVIETSGAIIDVLDHDQRYNDVGLCLGTKPQALGIGIAAELRPQFTLVCRMPHAYVETDTSALGKSWTYVVSDLSSGPAQATPG